MADRHTPVSDDRLLPPLPRGPAGDRVAELEAGVVWELTAAGRAAWVELQTARQVRDAVVDFCNGRTA